MPVRGLVLVLDNDSAATLDRVQAALAEAPGLELGEPAPHRLPAVLESSSKREAEARVEVLHRVSGIAAVDVVYTDFEDLLATDFEDLLAPPLEAAAREEV